MVERAIPQLQCRAGGGAQVFSVGVLPYSAAATGGHFFREARIVPRQGHCARLKCEQLVNNAKSARGLQANQYDECGRGFSLGG